MKFNLIETKEILDLEKEIGFELVVNERPKRDKVSKYYVSFEGKETGPCTLHSVMRTNAMHWWNNLPSATKTQICDTNTEVLGSVRRWETLTGSEIEKLCAYYA